MQLFLGTVTLNLNSCACNSARLPLQILCELLKGRSSVEMRLATL